MSLGRGRVGALFRRGLLPEDEERIGLPTLQKHEVIGFSPSVAIAGLVGPAVYHAAKDTPPSMIVHSVYIAAALARQGAGIAVVDEFTAYGFLSDELEFRLIEPAVTFELKALHLASHPLSRLARGFLDLKRSVIADRTAATAASRHCLEVIGAGLN
jgi:DNA-binding transcriptional LysR family regulator